MAQGNGFKTAIITALISVLSTGTVAVIVGGLAFADTCNKQEVEHIVDAKIEPIDDDVSDIKASVAALADSNRAMLEAIHTIDTRTRLTQQQVELLVDDRTETP